MKRVRIMGRCVMVAAVTVGMMVLPPYLIWWAAGYLLAQVLPATLATVISGGIGLTALLAVALYCFHKDSDYEVVVNRIMKG